MSDIVKRHSRGLVDDYYCYYWLFFINQSTKMVRLSFSNSNTTMSKSEGLIIAKKKIILFSTRGWSLIGNNGLEPIPADTDLQRSNTLNRSLLLTGINTETHLCTCYFFKHGAIWHSMVEFDSRKNNMHDILSIRYLENVLRIFLITHQQPFF